MRTEITHFTDREDIQSFHDVKQSQYDDAYGVTWAAVVKEYLQTAYPEKKAEIVLFEKAYKVLGRENVTAFYDADGNTLFDVENARLAKEYEIITKEHTEKEDESETDEETGESNLVPMGTVSLADIATGNIPDPTPEEVEAAVADNRKTVKERALEKLDAELKAAKDKSFAEPCIEYLKKRCSDDEGLSADVCQNQKKWEKCYSYIYEQARKSAKGSNQCAVRNDTVFEWAEDYFHLDDKAIEAKKAKESADRAKQHKENVKKQKEDQKKRIERMEKRHEAKDAAVAKTTTTEPAEKKPNKPKNEMEGQFSLFDLM